MALWTNETTISINMLTWVPLWDQVNNSSGLLSSLCLTLLIYWFFFQRTGVSLPPGPWGFPAIGYLPLFLSRDPVERVLARMSRKYGNIMSVYMYDKLTIILGDIFSIKEAFVIKGEQFSGRPDQLKTHKDEKGIIVSEGEEWRKHKNMISIILDQLVPKLETELMVEVDHFLEELKLVSGSNTNGGDCSQLIGVSAVNAIAILEFGHRFDYDDPRFGRLLKSMEPPAEDMIAIVLNAYFSWFKHLPFLHTLFEMEKCEDSLTDFRDVLEELICENKLSYDKNDGTSCFVNACFTKRKSGGNIRGYETEILPNLTREEVVGNAQSLFATGTGTVATTLRWCYLFMLLHPQVQKKVQDEIDRIVGRCRPPTYKDRHRMPYTHAVIMEVHRMASVSPVNDMHCNLEDTELCGFRIPKRTTIVANFWSVHNDPKLWTEPDKFKPDRFLNWSMNVNKPENLIPFGIGSRRCLGASFARMEIFLYFTSTLQRFNLYPPRHVTMEGTLPTFESMASRYPSPYNMRVVQR